MKEAIRSVDPALPLYDLKTMDERIGETLTIRRFAVLLLIAFAVIALFMATLGLYGVINYGVTQRTQEIGIRMALGAQRTEVVLLIIRDGLRMTVAGIGFGLISAIGFGRLIANQLFKVSPLDPPTLIGTALVLLISAIVAMYIPARRAASIDPLEACRYE
jgi:putative ABC transport system permease protein